MTVAIVDRAALEAKVKDMYTEVAETPHGEFHFEMGRALAERLGYAATDLDRIPAEAIDSFAGVGYYFHLADLNDKSSVPASLPVAIAAPSFKTNRITGATQHASGNIGHLCK